MWTLPEAAKRRRQSAGFAPGPFDLASASSETIAFSSPRASSASLASTTDFFLFVTVCTSPDDYFERAIDGTWERDCLYQKQ
jgi:hypothetical protein